MRIVDQQRLDALYTHIHRLTAAQRPPISSCTLAQVTRVLRNFGYQHFTRAETALCLYWQLAEGRLQEWPCQAFLEQVEQCVQRAVEESAAGEKQSPTPSLRSYWTQK